MYFDISWKNLTSLIGIDFPDGITELNCSHNSLTSLEGCPNSVTYLDCSNNSLTSLKNCPNSVTELDCSHNSLTSLKNCPNSVTYLDCSDNSLTSLEDCPNSVINLDCSHNSLTSLEICPNKVTTLDCDNNSLTSLQYCPNSVKHICYVHNPMCEEYSDKEVKDIHKINTIKLYKRGIEQVNTVISATKIQRLWKRYWYNTLDDNGINRYCKFALNQACCDGIVI